MRKSIFLTALIVLSVTVIFLSCKKTLVNEGPARSSVPTLGPTPNYTSSQNDELANLGRVLFYDRLLSLNNSVSCGSCHQQQKAFCDGNKVSAGLDNVKGSRNAPSIFAKMGRMFWDGRADSLGQLVLMPVVNHIEMNSGDFNALLSRVKATSYYSDLFVKAYGNNEISLNKMRIALREFVSNFQFVNNKFSMASDVRIKGISLSSSEEIGKNIFFGKGNCSQCHQVMPHGYGFTDEWHNTGLDYISDDKGVGAISKNTDDNGSFMTPVLLNVELTSPYMHDGRFKTLEEVVEHYNSGVVDNPNLDWQLRDFNFGDMTNAEALAKYDTNRNGRIDPNEFPLPAPRKLNLNPTEKKALVDFLKTLTDISIISDTRFKDPFLQ